MSLVHAVDWPVVRFGDVVRQVKDRVDPESSGLERYVAGEHMTTDDLHINTWGIVGDGYLGPAFHMRFRPGQVLYGSRRTYLRKVAVPHFEGICANTTFVCEPADDRVLPRLLPFFMQTTRFHEHSVRESKGSVNPYINWKDLAWYELRLPPRAAQPDLIELFEAAEAVVQGYRAVLAATNVLAATHLRHRLDHGDWPRKRLGDLADLRGGNAFPQREQGDVEGELPFIKVSDLDGTGNETSITRAQNYVSRETSRKLKAKPFPPGTVVFAKVGAALSHNRKRRLVTPTLMDNNLMGAIPKDATRPEFLHLALQNLDMSRFVQEGPVPSLAARTLARVEVPWPPNDVQDDIAFGQATVSQLSRRTKERLDSSWRVRQTLVDRVLGFSPADVH